MKKQLLINKNDIKYPNISSLPIAVINSKTVEKKIYKRPIIFNKEIKIKENAFFSEPFIFKKKESPVKTLRYINNDTGKMRHFTPGAQE
jgi:hypothetical protein